MKLHTLTINGLGSFQHPDTFHFTEGVTYIVGRNEDRPKVADSNGSGKTTLIDGVSVAMYGKAPSGRKKDGLINHNRDKFYIELIADALHIIREKTRGRGEKLKWHKGDGKWIQGDYATTQSTLETYLGISFETFCNTLYLTRASKTVKFLDAQPTERAKVLSELVDDSLFKKAADLILLDINRKEESRNRAITLLEELKRQDEVLGQDSIKLKDQLKQFTESDNIRRERVKRKMFSLQERAKKEQARLENPPEADIQELQATKVGLKSEIEDKRERIGALNHMLKGTDHSLDAGVTCPTCRQELDEDAAIELHEFIDIAQEEAVKLQEEIKSNELAIWEIEQEQDKLRSWRQIQTDVADKLDDIRYELKLLEDDLLPADTSNLKQILDENKRRQNEMVERIQELEKEIYEVTADLPYLKDLRRAFSSEIRNMMFDRIRGALEYYTNMYLKFLAGNEFEVEFPKQSATGREKFDILLRSANREQPLESYSEGETWRATFAVLLSLRRVLLEGNHSKAQWLFVDDPIGALDDSGARAFNRVLQNLSKEGGISQIICTVPRDTDWPSEARVVTVVRKNRASRLEN